MKMLVSPLASPCLGPALQRAHAGGAHGHNAPAARLACRNGVLGGLRHLVPLAVHLVLAQDLGLDRLKGARAHVQGDVGALHASSVQLGEQRVVKMQRGRGGCNRAGVFGKHGLVALHVVGRVAVGDVGRQRHMAVALHHGVRVVALSRC